MAFHATILDGAGKARQPLEMLKDRRKGQWSIRVNDQCRICFKWPEGCPDLTKVEFVVYH